MFTGIYTALITPFRQDGSFDEQAYKKLIEEQILAGVDGIVPCGSTGESSTLSIREHLEIIRMAVDQVAGRIQVIAGAGSNCTAEAVNLTKEASHLGVDGTLQIAPYYNKPSQEGLYRHYAAIAEVAPRTNLVIYNVPGRCGVSVDSSTVLRLSKISNINAVKDASGNVNQAIEIIANAGEDFSLLSGDDNLILSFMAVGAKGLISVASNLFPREVAQMVKLLMEGDFVEGRKIFYKLKDFFSVCFCETNPVPIKAMMAERGYCQEIFRLPLTEPSLENKQKMNQVLKNLMERI